MSEVQRWMQLMRQAVHIDKPKEIHVSREFHEKLVARNVEVAANLGEDMAGQYDPAGEMTFRRIPIVVD